MLKEVTSEIRELSRDLKFVRNLSLASILAIACIFSLIDIQNQSNKASGQPTMTNVSQSTPRFVVGH